MSLQAAPAYYEYGNALLVQQEENPSDTLLGNADSNGDDGNQANAVEDTVVNDDDDDEDQGEDEKDDDLQIAWENLDVLLYMFLSFLFLIVVIDFYAFSKRWLA